MRAALLLLAAMPLAALDNSVTIRNTFTGALTDHPIAFGRFFARGEIANFCKSYLTPSDTGTRAAATTWQCTELNRWNDTSAARTITAARVGAPTWSTGAGGGITNIQVVSGIATITFTSSIAGLIAAGDRLVVSGAASNYQYGSMDNVVVMEVTDTTHVKYISRSTSGGGAAFVTTATYSSGVQVAQMIDPNSPTDVCRFTSANHGFYRGDPVTIADVEGLTGANGSFIVTGATRNEFVINASCSGTYTEGGTATGTSIGAGSLRLARVAVLATVPSGGTTKIDFQNSTDPSSAGNAAATAAAGFDEAEMLAYQPDGMNDWNFKAVLTADVKAGATAALNADARTMLTAGDFTSASYCGNRIWARGPVDTVAIVEFGCSGALTYDIGWKIRNGTTFTASVASGDTTLNLASVADISLGTILYAVASNNAVETMTVTAVNPGTCTAPCVTVTRATTGAATSYASARGIAPVQWEDATGDVHKSLHPQFTLRFINDWAGVGGRIAMHNDWGWKIQNIWYSIDYQTGDTPSSRIAVSTFKHSNSTSWQISTWDGADPEFYCSGGSGTDPDNCSTTGGGTRARKFLIDHNTPYLIYARALPEWKLFASKTTALDSAATGYASSDKGGFTSTSLGGGTYGNQPLAPGGTPSSPTKGAASGQEAWVLGDIPALWLQNWSAAGYEINFGDSLGGGGGNVEAQWHIPIYEREDNDTSAQPRFVMPGFGGAADRAHNRAYSLYARPTYITPRDTSNTAAASDFDKRRTACNASAPSIPHVEHSGTATFADGNRGWPCYYQRTAGNDGWSTSSDLYMHQNDWFELAYLTTADHRYLEGMQAWAAWNNGWDHGSPGRGIGRSWTQQNTGSSSWTRAAGGWVQAIFRAAVWTPNVPQFGYTVPSVESFYWNEKLWDAGLSQEGLLGITNGNFHAMYPHIDLSSCPGAGAAAANASNIWYWPRCAVVGNKTNTMGEFSILALACDASYPWTNCATHTYAVAGHWQYYNAIVGWGRAKGLGLTMFDYSRQKWANYEFSLLGSANWNPFMSNLYQMPVFKNSLYIPTIAEMFDGLKATWSPSGSGCASRTSQVWCSLDNISYGTQKRAGLASLSDLAPTVTGNLDGCAADGRTPKGCTWVHGWNFLNRTFTAQNTWNEIPKYILEPRADILDLTCTPGATTAVCTFTAPTNDAATYAVVATGTGFASTLDATCTSGCPAADTAITSTGRARKFVITGLTAATGYTVRVTAGQRVSGFYPTAATGTGRTTTTFTTLAAEGGADTITVRAYAPPGATTATLEYGTTSSLGSTLAPGAVACSTGCSFNVPGNTRALVYYRITYKNGLGTTVAVGSALPLVIQ